jgi:hypothetical protein
MITYGAGMASCATSVQFSNLLKDMYTQQLEPTLSQVPALSQTSDDIAKRKGETSLIIQIKICDAYQKWMQFATFIL